MRTALQLFVSLFLLCLPARATSVRAPDFETLVDRADLIFAGRAISQRSEWRNDAGVKCIVTLVSFKVEAVHKGKADAVITLQFLGGTMGDTTMDVAEMPRFNAGERVILFIENNGVAASPVIGFYHGRFSLRKIGATGEEVLKHDGTPLADVAEIGREKRAAGARASRKALSHDQFTGRIRERLARSGASPP